MIRVALWIHRRGPAWWLPDGLTAWAWQHAPDPEAPTAVREWWLNLAIEGKRIPPVPQFGQGRRP